MALKFNDSYANGFVSEAEIAAISSEVLAAQKTLLDGTGEGNGFLGWVTLPDDYDKEEFARIKAAAAKIQKKCDVFIVIGIGGSYLGSRAVIEFLKSPSYNALKKETPDIYFSGCNISAQNLSELLSICEGRDVCINVISKSGTTTEPAVAFRVFRALLEKKYGKEEAKERIFVTTDKAKGTLKKFADEEGYETFVVPDNVGGRFSVLTAVGLLPIAVSGVDLDALMKGASDAAKEYAVADLEKNPALRYAALRNILYRKGYGIEVLVSYENYATMLNEWWKQLFGESEGKENKGIFPASVIYSTDLHSMGQYMQEGRRALFETFVEVAGDYAGVAVPTAAENLDGLQYLEGREVDNICKVATQATREAHAAGGVPVMQIIVPDVDERSLGALIYFFEMACALSAFTLGVNPFNQPGVEAYKTRMFELLGKPGYNR